MTVPIAPSETLFVRNLSDKIPNSDIKKELYYLFSHVSPVVEVECRRGKSRGMAWISFANTEFASAALMKLNKFEFLGQPLDIEFAKSRSKTIAEMYEMLTARKSLNIEETVEKEETRAIEIKGLPPKLPIGVITAISKQFSGFQKIDTFDERTIATFETIEQAKAAIAGFKARKIGDNTLDAVMYYEKK